MQAISTEYSERVKKSLTITKTLSILTTGCAINEHPQAGNLEVVDRYQSEHKAPDTQNGVAFSQPDLSDEAIVFIDSEAFDRDLSEELAKKNREVKVVFAGRVNINQLPERLNKWFTQLKRGGGELHRKPVRRTRGAFSGAVEMVIEGMAYFEEIELMEPTKYYDAIVYFRGDGTIESVVWQMRNA